MSGNSLNTPRWKTVLARWVRSPLLQFLLAGTLLFAGHALWQQGEGNALLVPEDLRVELRDMPAPERDRWLLAWARDEVLFREALRQGLHLNDAALRARLAETVFLQSSEAAAITEPMASDVEAWWEARGTPGVPYSENPAQARLAYLGAQRAQAREALAARLLKDMQVQVPEWQD